MRRVLVASIFCLYGGTAFAQFPGSDELGNRVDAVAKQLLSRYDWFPELSGIELTRLLRPSQMLKLPVRD